MNRSILDCSKYVNKSRLIFKCFAHNRSETSAVVLAEDVFESKNEPTNRCLIITHGLFGSKTNWRSLAKAFSERGRLKVVTVDLRNHGDSPHTESMTYDDMANDLLEVVKKYKTAQTILMGHSMGGKAAMMVALKQPTLIQKLIVVDIAPHTSASVDEIPNYSKILLDNMNCINDAKNTLQARKKMDLILQESAESLKKNKGIRDFLLTLITQDSNGKFVWRANLPVINKYINDIMEFPSMKNQQSIDNLKTVFVSGEKSNYISAESLPIINKLFPQNKLIKVANAGHWVHSENPNEFIRLVLPEILDT
ncbi:unnamed protein product [Didymodactylos carnosus]|uniref:sn-1-specific diacylglycerol lipase ABHD11 n=1 Tax=Didymodactylos carnosus TaxID=1234261 RepID=A0A813QGH1_9BILA|nr:unnamed protein product [Didymodactylos carnosus]CAF3548863.1 unnamed protein product [Didymodactylos carnosus]